MGVASDSKLSVRLAVRTPEVMNAILAIIQEMDSYVLQDDSQATRVDVLVLEIGSDTTAELETMRVLLREGAVGTLFVTSAQATPDILLPALRTGAREFFQQPIIAREVREAFAQVLAQARGGAVESKSLPPPGHIYSVLGAKGGVGTTTFAVNLAASIQAQDVQRPVALIDLNRLLGEVPLFLDLETDFNWEEIGKNINRLDPAYLKSALVRHSSGLYVMPAPVWVEASAALPPDFFCRSCA